MDELLLARHGESEAGASGRVGGDPPLTAAGRRQAEALAAQVASFPAEVCLTSGAVRARETAELALAGRDVPIEILRELGDVRFGSFEGGRLAEYREWVGSHPPSEEAPGGESRAGTLRRFAGAFRVVLSRPERHVFVVAHGLTIRALLDPRPQPVVAGAPYGGFVRLTRAQVESAVERLERWCEDPSW
jgi:2,3-bisphosphoglycerate-dependent phosphoglycerate mutase